MDKNWVFFRILHEILSGNQLWLIFFGPLIRVLGGVKVEKVYSIGDFDKNTKNRHFWVSFIGKRPKMMRTNFSILFWDKIIFWLGPFRHQHTVWPSGHGYLGIFWEDGPRQKFFIWSFLCSAIVSECFKRKKPECIMGSRDSTLIWSWPILTILTKITIFGHWLLSNQAFIKYNGMRFEKPYTLSSK